jgi:putative endonuclease
MVEGLNPLACIIIMAISVYILESESTGRFYIGQAKSVSDRLAYHNAGYSISLRNRGPWKLVYQEQYATRSEAIKRERQLKSWKDHKMIERLVSASR